MLKTVVALTMFAASAAAAQSDSISMVGCGVISRPDSGESFSSLSPDGKELYYTIHRPDWSRHRIVGSRRVNGAWTAPATLPFSGTYNDREPKLTPDGRRMYFSSNRPILAGDTTRRRDLDLWMVERTGDTWSAPRHVDAPVNSDVNDFCPVISANGTVYFISMRAGGIRGPKPTDLHNVWRARPVDASGLRFAAPENMGAAINSGYETNVYVTPNERTMLVSRDGAPDGLGGDDLYVSHFVNGAWQAMTHLPAPINSKEYEYGPMISPDGAWFYFTSHRNGGNADLYRAPISVLERDGVHRAVQDYLEGFYEGDTAKFVRSLRPELFKYGFWLPKDSTSYEGERMTFAEALTYARNFREKNRTTPATAPREIEIFDVQDQTASAKVRAWWGTDYLLLGKYDGAWMISHVMWQSSPPRD